MKKEYARKDFFPALLHAILTIYLCMIAPPHLPNPNPSPPPPRKCKCPHICQTNCKYRMPVSNPSKCLLQSSHALLMNVHLFSRPFVSQNMLTCVMKHVDKTFQISLTGKITCFLYIVLYILSVSAGTVLITVLSLI